MHHLTAALLLLSACAPPVAPKELQQLACYTFDHAADDDDEMLTLGLENLNVWMGQEHEEDIEEGYQISLLVQSVVADLEGDNHSLSDDLVGAAVAHESAFTVEDFAKVMIAEDWANVIGDQYEYYDKTYSEGKDCIVSKDCLWAEATSESELVQLGVSVVSKNRIQYRWVELESGWAFIHRSWLTEPPEVSSDLIDPNSQYFISVTLPRDPVVRVQATWIDTKILGVSVPKSIVVSTMRDQGDQLEAWMSENY